MADERLGASFSIDITQLQAGLRTANKLIRESQSQFKAAAAGMDDWTKSEAGLNARISSLNSITQVQQQKVNALKTQYQQLINEGLDPTSDRAIQLRTQINNEQAALARNETEVRRCTDALDKLGDESREAGKGSEEASEGYTVLKQVLANLATDAIHGAIEGLKKLGSAVISVGKQAIESYADYEQLIGGVETLFGTGGMSVEEYAKSVGKSVKDVQGEYDTLMQAQNEVITNANNAYKTAGMSANEYMSNVTSFSASLIGSLGGDTKKAASMADMAMTDISDNANKMGTDMDMIVQTYQSLSRGNFQMLDNLKLGYGGTKTEMERLIADANKVKEANGEMADLSIDSFADMTEAIHIIQDEMGISGTTAKEASTTIQGSIGAMKGAWGNLLTGMADETQDFDQLITNFIDSVGTVAQNLIPRISVVMKGLLKLIQGLIPQIPPLLEQFLPVLIEGTMNLITGLVEVMPTVIQAFLQVVPQFLTALTGMLPTMITSIMAIITQIITALSTMLPEIVNAIIEVVPLIVTALVNSLPQLLQAAITLLMAIVQALPVIIQKLTTEVPKIVSTIVSVLIKNLPLIINAAITLFTAIIQAIPKILPDIVRAIPSIIDAIFDALTSPEAIQAIKTAGSDLIKGLWNGIKDMAGWIGDKIKGFGKGVLDNLKDFFGIKSPSKVMENIIGKNLALGIGKGFENNIGKVNDKIQSAMNFESPTVNVNGRYGKMGGGVVINQTNNYSQAHSRYEIYKSKQQTAAAVRLALGTV